MCDQYILERILRHATKSDQRYTELAMVSRTWMRYIVSIVGIKGPYNVSVIVMEDNIEALRYLCKLVLVNLSSIWRTAAEYGSIWCLKYIIRRGAAGRHLNEILDIVIKRGHLLCLAYLHEIGCYMDEYAAMVAAEYNQLECLKYIHENLQGSMTRHVAENAFSSGSLECLRYLVEHGCYDLQNWDGVKRWRDLLAGPHGDLDDDIQRCVDYLDSKKGRWRGYRC